jgi:hypothetical protein
MFRFSRLVVFSLFASVILAPWGVVLAAGGFQSAPNLDMPFLPGGTVTVLDLLPSTATTPGGEIDFLAPVKGFYSPNSVIFSGSTPSYDPGYGFTAWIRGGQIGNVGNFNPGYVGVLGLSLQNYGVFGASSVGTGVYGRTYAASGTANAGVYGVSVSAWGVYGETSGTGYGVYGHALRDGHGVVGDSVANYGVQGISQTNYGVAGLSNSKAGVYGATGQGYGVQGVGLQAGSWGVYGQADSAGSVGVYGSSSLGRGVVGVSGNYVGVEGDSSASTGVSGNSMTGLGVYGSSGNNVGVYGWSSANIGTQGYSQSSIGVYGMSQSNIGVYGYTGNVNAYGVDGYNNATGCFGLLGYNIYGAYSSCKIWVAGTEYASDARLKKNVEPIGKGLDIIMALKPVTYQWKTDSKNHELVTDKSKKAVNYGFVAQDVMEVLPDLVSEAPIPSLIPGKEGHAGTTSEKAETTLGLDYNGLIAPTVKAVQELAVQVQELKKANDELRQEVEALKVKK